MTGRRPVERALTHDTLGRHYPARPKKEEESGRRNGASLAMQAPRRDYNADYNALSAPFTLAPSRREMSSAAFATRRMKNVSLGLARTVGAVIVMQ